VKKTKKKEKPEKKQKKIYIPDKDGWIDIESQGHPDDLYGLCLIKYEDATTQKMWWTGAQWDGLKDLKPKNVLAWKYMQSSARDYY